jgi:hypothetical protein
MARAGLGLAAFVLSLGHAAPSQAFSPFLVVPDPAVAEQSPAYRYANMSNADALAELDRRQILYLEVDAAPGVRAPVRLTGRLHGVNFHSSLPPEERVDSMFEILDARLALALDDFAAILEQHDIDEVVHYTMYRPNVGGPEHGVGDEPGETAGAPPIGSRRRPVLVSRGHAPRPVGARPATPQHAAPATRAAGDKPARAPARTLGKGTLDVSGADGRAREPAGAKQKNPGDETKPAPALVSAKHEPTRAHRVPPAPRTASAASPLHRTTRAAPGTRHPAGLAIDVGLLHNKKTGRWLSVASQFRGHIGERTCGEGARTPDEPEARELRSLVCEASDQGIFTYVLTPNFNAAHADHYHMEIKPGVRWFLYH